MRADAALIASGEDAEVRGAAAVAQRFLRRGGARAVYPVVIDGVAGLMVAPQGHLRLVLKFTIANGKVVSIDGVGDPVQLSQLELLALGD